MTDVLIMSGGRSERMRAGGCPIHKALRRVGDQSLIERNLMKACQSGFQNIWVAVSCQEPTLLDWLRTRGRQVADLNGAHLSIVIEESPLGTIGAAGLVPGNIDDLLVVNVDNLTGIDFRDLAAKHTGSGTCMTIAVHQEYFQIPFGRVDSTDGFLDSYLEKPFVPVTISSGVYVLTQRTKRAIPQGVRIHVPDLVNTLRSAGERILCYEHNTAWIDINDERALAHANSRLHSFGAVVQA